MERLRERIGIAKKALKSFEESALSQAPNQIERDAAIQRFEYTVEAVWKAAQRYLQMIEGLSEGSPKGAIRRLREVGILNENLASQALAMIDDRNLTVHTYNEALADQIYLRLRGYVSLMQSWLSQMEKRIESK